MSVTVPFRLHRSAVAETGGAPSGPVTSGGDAPVPPRPRRRPSTPRPEPEPARVVRLGHLGLASAAAYLLVWTAVLFVVEVLVFLIAHAALLRLGVLESVSRAAATVLDRDLPASGVLPVLELDALLPWALVVAGALAGLWLLTSLSLVLVHNCICSLTGGPRVRLR